MDGIDYPRWIAEALREVARRALEHAAREGLPGEHHFYVSFRTGAPGVEVAPFLREQHPDEMTIILQKQFWDLEADAAGFSVTLSFGGSEQRLHIPWPAVTAFADPAAELGLRFEPAAAREGEQEAGGEAAPDDREVRGPAAGGEVVSLERFRRDHRPEG
jgi:hypothetical protein